MQLQEVQETNEPLWSFSSTKTGKTEHAAMSAHIPVTLLHFVFRATMFNGYISPDHHKRQTPHPGQSKLTDRAVFLPTSFLPVLGTEPTLL